MSDKMQIRHIAIRSEDPDQLGAFYEKPFGFTAREPQKIARVFVEEGTRRMRIRRTRWRPPCSIKIKIRLRSIRKMAK